MIIKQIGQANDLLVNIKQKLNQNPFYIDLNQNIGTDFQNSAGPLRGILFDLKLNFITKQYKSDASSKILSNFIPSYNCTVYDILKSNGALFVGKTNCDEFAVGSLGVASIYGSVFYQNCYTGGSSSGSGYTSKMIVDISFGTDTGGSCRLPSLFTRVFSYKPSKGAISRYGVIEYSKSLDCVGCLFRNPNTAHKVLNYLIQVDYRDSWSNMINKARNKSFKLLVLYENMFNEYESPILKALQSNYKYETSSIKFNLKSITSLYDAYSCMSILSECYKYDLMRFHNDKSHGLSAINKENRYNYFGNKIKEKFVFGALILSDEELRKKYYNKSQELISEIILTMDNLTKDNILVFPSMFPNIDETEAILKIANLAGLPSITLPICDSIHYKENVPLKYSGVILIAGYGQDLTLIAIAKYYYRFLLKKDE